MITAQLGVAALAICLCATGCGRAGFTAAAEPQGEAALEISRVVVDAERVQPGQEQVEVRLHLRNRTTAPLTALSATPRFLRDGQDLGASFEVEAAADNAAELPRAEGAVLTFWVKVSADLGAGPVTVDAFALAQMADGAEARADRALEPDTLEVVVPEQLVVTTADDEDDTGGAPSVAAAGGLMDLSLREALLIANVVGSPRLILFDPAVFPPGAATVIEVDPTLGLLPEVSAAFLTIDGRAAEVSIDGAAVTAGSGLVIAAHDFTMRAVTMRGFNGGEHHHCLLAREGDRVQLLECSFERCGMNSGSGAQVVLGAGRDHLVADSVFVNGERDGLHVLSTASGVQVLRNQFISNADDGLEVFGHGHLIADNLIQGNGGNGAENYHMTDVVFRDNTFSDNGGGADGGRGMHLKLDNVGVVIEGGSFARNADGGLMLGADCLFVQVSQVGFEDNGGVPITLELGANEGVSPPVITALSGGSVAGTADAEGGVVEVYSYGDTREYLTSATVAGGAWSAPLASTTPAVYATLTTAAGSTSAFSDLALDGPRELIVTTSDDELDGGAEILSVNQAGGAADLSLREALVLANAWYGPDRVTFSPAAFPPGGETVISLRQPPEGLGPLPRIIDHGTAVDGSGASVTIEGGGVPMDTSTGALSFAADGGEVRALTIRDYNAQDGGCVHLRYYDALTVADSTLSSCGGLDSGAGIYVRGTSHGNFFVGNTISNSHRAIWGYAVHDSLIQGNDLSSRSGDCVTLHFDSDGNQVVDNWIHDCGDEGVQLSDSSDVALILGNRIYGCSGDGIAVCADCDHVEVSFNTVVGALVGVASPSAADNQLSIQNNILAANAEAGIRSVSGTTLHEAHNLLYDNAGDGVSGAAAVMVEEGPDAGVYVSTPPDPSDVLADPTLADAPGGDMTPGAAAIDVGVDLGYDRNGASSGMFNGSAPDLGAVETP